ncbi:hypothetical protein D3C71_1362330 [compost metagenome]
MVAPLPLPALSPSVAISSTAPLEVRRLTESVPPRPSLLPALKWDRPWKIAAGTAERPAPSPNTRLRLPASVGRQRSASPRRSATPCTNAL